MPSVNVTINGKNYRMACDEGQEDHLLALAAKFDGHVDQLKGSFGEIGDQRLTVMAGVMVTDKVDELEEKLAKLEAELVKVKETKAIESRQKQAGDDDLAKGIKDAAKKIEQLSLKLSGSA